MAEEDLIEKLKKLSPKERIERLKEIQEKDKAEIEEAQTLIRESEEQAEREEEARKIPIPQLKSVDIGALFSPEEKELFKTKRFAAERTKEAPKEEPKVEEKQTLEEELAGVEKLPEDEAKAHADYVAQLSQKPATQLKERMTDIYNTAKETGYVSANQQKELNDIHYATKKKLEDIESGKYANVSREVAGEMVITEKMKNWLQESYGR
jgi:hypothetical protein